MFKSSKFFATATLAICLSSGIQTALAQSHDSHSHNGKGSIGLALNNGKKWATDDNLRKAMSSIRDVLAVDLPAIHSGKLSAKQYRALAGKVDAEINFILQNCKLNEDADAMLHLILAEISSGSSAMANQRSNEAKHHGAKKIVHALENYGAYFDHPDWHVAK